MFMYSPPYPTVSCTSGQFVVPISGRGDEIPQHFDVVDESDGDDGIVGGESEDGEESKEVIDDEVAPWGIVVV